MVAVVCLGVSVLTEFVSNPAAASLLMPIVAPMVSRDHTESIIIIIISSSSSSNQSSINQISIAHNIPGVARLSGATTRPVFKREVNGAIP